MSVRNFQLNPSAAAKQANRAGGAIRDPAQSPISANDPKSPRRPRSFGINQNFAGSRRHVARGAPAISYLIQPRTSQGSSAAAAEEPLSRAFSMQFPGRRGAPAISRTRPKSTPALHQCQRASRGWGRDEWPRSARSLSARELPAPRPLFNFEAGRPCSATILRLAGASSICIRRFVVLWRVGFVGPMGVAAVERGGG